MRRICILLLLFLIFGISPAESMGHDGTPSLSVLREGKDLLDRGRYADAIEKLKIAEREIPVISDYTLFFLATASSKLERVDDSNAYLDELLKAFPESLLRKKARHLRILNTISGCERDREFLHDSNCEGAVKSLEGYVADYPEDSEMAFLLARLLRKQGKTDRATRLMKEIYISSSPFSESALQELRPSDITAEDLLAKASNLIKDTEYKKAENLLRNALTLSGPPLKREIKEKLGTALFKQKRYREAAEEFTGAGDFYSAARAHYRAGELAAFQKILSKLLSSKDSRAGTLLIALSSKKRREGSTEEAIKIFMDVKRRFPLLSEEALWGIGWTFYRKGDFDRALNALTELSATYRNAKYLYWKARALEKTAGESTTGKKAQEINILYRDVQAFPNEFYALLAPGKRESMPEGSGDAGMTSPLALTLLDEPVIGNDFCTLKSGLLPENTRSSVTDPSIMKDMVRYFDRFDILSDLGMRDEAIGELTFLSGIATNPDVIIHISLKLQGAGAYRKSISLMSQLRKRQDSLNISANDLDLILYPFAFWPVVRDVSFQYQIEPLVILSVMREESRFDPDARSIAGALGLMQIMPQTAFTLSNSIPDIPKRPEIHDVKTNITLGAYYLHSLLRDFSSLPAALAAYNAGEERVREWLKHGNYSSQDEFIEDIPFDETRTYVKRVLTSYAVYRRQAMKHLSACKHDRGKEIGTNPF
jgi:peptidoglycan lytic transglycosylase